MEKVLIMKSSLILSFFQEFMASFANFKSICIHHNLYLVQYGPHWNKKDSKVGYGVISVGPMCELQTSVILIM